MRETHPPAQRYIGSHYRAWMLLCAIFAIHITDEASTGFLKLWNPEVLAIRAHHPWMIIPAFSFPVWITLLALAVLGFLVLSVWVRRGLPWTVYASYAFIFLMLSNGLAHLGFSIDQKAWMSGAYTSPLLIAGSVYLWIATARRSLYSS